MQIKKVVTMVDIATKNARHISVMVADDASDLDAIAAATVKEFGGRAFYMVDRGATGDGSRFYGQVFQARKRGPLNAFSLTGNVYADVTGGDDAQ